MTSNTVDWVAVDLGTTTFRVWIFGRENQFIDHFSLDKVAGHYSLADIERTVLDAISSHLVDGPTPVICSGMVGKKHETPLSNSAKVPCAPIASDRVQAVETIDPRIALHVLPGVKQTSPADIMRGEEIVIAGFLAENPKFDGIICLPGVHTKWVHISADEIVSFRTFMTGELIALLSQQSEIQCSVQDEGWDDVAFEDAISDIMGSPQNLASKLFGLRADSLLNGLTGAEAKSKLSGMLIGLELAGAKPFWLGQRVAIVGDPNLARLYESALASLYVPAEVENGERMRVLGFKLAHENLIGSG